MEQRIGGVQRQELLPQLSGKMSRQLQQIEFKRK